MLKFPGRRRQEIDLDNPLDRLFWAGTWALTDQELADAVAAVGPIVEDVAAHLGQPVDGRPAPDI